MMNQETWKATLDLQGNSRVKSVGIGLTNRCDLKCGHCYSRRLPTGDLSLDDVKQILACFPDLERVNFGTGESVLCPDFFEILDLLRSRGVGMALTTNGLTVGGLSDDQLECFKDIDVSLDFPSAAMHDEWRGRRGAWADAVRALARCRHAGLNTSIALALMNHNYRYLPGFRSILDEFDICLRLNVYKPVWTRDFELSYDQFWGGNAPVCRWLQSRKCLGTDPVSSH